MSAEIIDGKALSREVMEDLKPRIASLKEKGIIPGLTVIIVGTDNDATFWNMTSACTGCSAWSILYFLYTDLEGTIDLLFRIFR